jgi:hypothetical protein
MASKVLEADAKELDISLTLMLKLSSHSLRSGPRCHHDALFHASKPPSLTPFVPA